MMVQLPQQQNPLFYEFCLAKHIPENQLLRLLELSNGHCVPIFPSW